MKSNITIKFIINSVELVNYNRTFTSFLLASMLFFSNCGTPLHYRANSYDMKYPKKSGILIIKNQMQDGDYLPGAKLILDDWQLSTGDLEAGKEMRIKVSSGAHTLQIQVDPKIRPLLFYIGGNTQDILVNIKDNKTTTVILKYSGKNVNIGTSILIDTLGLLILLPLYVGFVNMGRDIDLSIEN